MNEWTTVCRREQVNADNPLGAEVDGTAVGIYEVEGQLHALEDICPHASANLSEGFIEGCEVECPLHAAVFDIPSGKYLRGEICRDLRVFPVRVVGIDIQVQIVPA